MMGGLTDRRGCDMTCLPRDRECALSQLADGLSSLGTRFRQVAFEHRGGGTTTTEHLPTSDCLRPPQSDEVTILRTCSRPEAHSARKKQPLRSGGGAHDARPDQL